MQGQRRETDVLRLIQYVGDGSVEVSILEGEGKPMEGLQGQGKVTDVLTTHPIGW